MDAEAEKLGGYDSVLEVPVELRELTEAERLEAVRIYFRSADEVPDSVLSGGYNALVAHWQGRLH